MDLPEQDTFRDDRFATGDGGEIADGVLRITDRQKDVVVSGGENVFSLQTEAVLQAHSDVAEATVIDVPHERWGDTVNAVVVLRAGAELDEPG